MADEQVEALLEEGWRPKDIALITMGARHPVQAERQQTMGFAGYWDDFWSNDDIFYGHVLELQGDGTPGGGAVRQRGRHPRPWSGTALRRARGRPIGWSWWVTSPRSSGWVVERWPNT